MRYPWANAFILATAALSLVSGYFGMTAGDAARAWYLDLHRVSGYGVVVLLLWKGRNILAPVLRRFGRWSGQDLAAMLMLALLLASLGLGVAWAHAGRFSLLGFSGVTWHINVGLAVVPLLGWHLLRYRRLLRPRFWAERRAVLRMVGLAAAGILVWQATARVERVAAWAGASRRFTGSYPVGDFSGNAFPTTSWLNDDPRPILRDTWRLEVSGAVERGLSLRLDDLIADASLTATLDCTGGWHSTQRWRGVPLGAVLDMASPTERAASVSVVSATGYYRRFSLNEAREMLLASHVGGEPLSHGHGAPWRLVVPGKRGFEWVKWVTRLEVNETGKWLQPPLPIQ